MLTNETLIILFTVYCFLVSAPATRFSLRFGKQSWNVVVGAGTRLLFFYSEYFGRLLSCNERSEISQRECVLWYAHLMKYCVQSKICVYFMQDARQNESLNILQNFGQSLLLNVFTSEWSLMHQTCCNAGPLFVLSLTLSFLTGKDSNQ